MEQLTWGHQRQLTVVEERPSNAQEGETDSTVCYKRSRAFPPAAWCDRELALPTSTPFAANADLQKSQRVILL
jgi:hypothetical protein